MMTKLTKPVLYDKLFYMKLRILYKHILCFFSYLLVFIVSSQNLHALAEGKAQISIASPDPANAGEQITFRTALLNQGNEIWEKNKYYVQAEIFNENKKYVGRIRSVKDNSDIRPGETATTEIIFSVPTNYNGTYFYKIYLIMDNKYIIESDFIRFDVSAISPKEHKAFWKSFGGSLNVSLRDTDKNNWKDFVGSINLNSISYDSENPTQFFFNTYHTAQSTDTTGIRNELFSFLFSRYGNNYSFELGDIFPNFSKLALSNMSMRGLYLENRIDKVSTELVIARVETPSIDSNATNIINERWLTGAKVKYKFSPKLTLGTNYVYSYEEAGNIERSSQTLTTPSENKVWGAIAGYQISEPLELETEFMLSNNAFVSTRTTTTDYGWMAGLNYKKSKLISSLYLQETQPDFYSYGAPGIQNDRRTFDFQNTYKATDKIDFGLGYNQWFNNLKKDKSKITTTQKTYSANTGYIPPAETLSKITIGYSFSEAIGDLQALQDNYTYTLSLNYFKRIKKTATVSFDFQSINYTDKTCISDNCLTYRNGFYLSTPVNKSLNLNMGINLLNSQNLVKDYLTAGQNYSISIVYDIIKDLLSTQVWAYYTVEKNDASLPAEKIDSTGVNTNLEFSIKLKKYLTWVLGGIYIMNDAYSRNTFKFDKTDERGVTTRIILDF